MTLKTPEPEAAAPESGDITGPTLRLTARGGGRNALEKRLHILIKAVEQSPISILVTDSQGLIEYVNPKFTKLTGYALADVLGKTPRVLKGGFLSPEFYEDLWRTIKGGQEWHGVFHNRTKDGSLLWELASISPIRDKAGVITHFVGVKEDITELKRLQERTSYLAHHDPLTSLPNRLLFFDQLKHALTLARRREAAFAVLYLDLDGFKAVNDSLGHEAGDTLLAAMATRILDSVRSSDTVARMGGDEFTVLLEDLGDRAHAAEVAQLILDKVGAPCLIGATVLTLGASIGISFFPGDGEDADQLLSAADAAMYVAKRGGKGGYRFASEG
jgi:diguanylate cyclase (GGDEF)-like protein/PAS domain S-box-containing protein